MIIDEFDKIPDCWSEIREIRDTIANVSREIGKNHVPKTSDVFRIFHEIRPSQVKVIIVGQDPYSGIFEHHGDKYYVADGRAFSSIYSSKYGQVIPAMLKNILREVRRTYGDVKATSDLTPWIKQGVMLINLGLTIGKKRESHIHLWTDFVGSVLTSLSRETKAVLVLVGAKAQSLLRNGYLSECNFPIVKAPHPSPMNTRNPFVGSDTFKQIDSELEKLKHEPIKWTMLD